MPKHKESNVVCIPKIPVCFALAGVILETILCREGAHGADCVYISIPWPQPNLKPHP